MKLIKLLSVIICSLALVAGTAFAEGKEGKKSCCEKAKAAGKECTHPCCVEAKKAGKKCEKCSAKKEKKEGEGDKK